MKAAFYTLGCKVNQYESNAMGDLLKKNGFEIVSHKDDADIYIINSCAVTAEAERKSGQYIRRFKANHPGSVIILAGCASQAYPERSDAYESADIIIGNKSQSMLIPLIDEFLKTGEKKKYIPKHEKGESFDVLPISSFEERTRAYVKIQDGCDRFCSYCVIPYSRGRARSKPLDMLKNEVEDLALGGFREIVLVGINLSSYGRDIGVPFPEAVRAAASVDGVERVRLGSLEPDHLTPDMISELSKIKKLCPHFHISLQSGCDKTLKAMNRHYTAEEFFEIACSLRKTFPDCSLTTDVMTGFSGETENDFIESLEFVKKLRFEKVHVFPYSVRPGTKAENFPDQIEKGERNRRAKIMIGECEKIRQAYFASLAGETLNVLFETNHGEAKYIGHSENYTPVVAGFEGRDLRGLTLPVTIVKPGDGDFVEGIIKGIL